MNSNNPSNIENRAAVVAGQFYPAVKEELLSTLKELYKKAEPRKTDNVLAIISPHAGYVFSGNTAASAFNQIDTNKKYKNIFLIGSSHKMSFEGASIYNKGNFITPIGIVNVDLALANKLINENKIFGFGTDAHKYEHCLEVQLPFLQYIMKSDYKIIPIVIGAEKPSSCKEIAKALKPYFNSDNLFIISTDFSHYPEYKNAVDIDKLTADAIISNSAEKLITTLSENDMKRIPGLATSLCGWTSVLTLLYITENNSNYTFTPVSYQNSGDSGYGEKANVVGYYSIAISTKELKTEDAETFNFTEKDKKELLDIARNTINQLIKGKKFPKINSEDYSANIKKQYGAFVTLYKNKQLRGCIGRFTSDIPLYEVIREMTIASATEDSRFEQVTADELNELEIEISVLSPKKKINSIDEIELGRDGIYIKKGMMSGTFLPKVAIDTNWSKEEFLSHCSRDKAGIGWDGWKDKNAEIYIYQAFVITE